MKLLAILALTATVLAAPASAGKPQEFSLQTDVLDIAGIVEQQSASWPDCWMDINDSACDQSLLVRNTTECMWDVDDRWRTGAFGTLATSSSASVCVIADGVHRLWGIYAYAPTPDLSIVLRFEEQGVEFTFSAVQVDRKRWEYGGCVTGPIYADWPSLPAVSNGNGLPSTVTLSVAGVSGRVLRDVLVQLDAGSDSPGSIRRGYCRGEQSDFFEMAGALWRSAL